MFNDQLSFKLQIKNWSLNLGYWYFTNRPRCLMDRTLASVRSYDRTPCRMAGRSLREYVLKLSNGDLYKGSTSNLRQRIAQHKIGKVNSTKNKNPKLIHYECYLRKSDAERRERFLKTTEGKRLLKQQLKDLLSSFNG